MDFINFVLPDSALSNGISSPVILKTRREELGLTQQQVATGARLQLVQYQRLERGERTIESSTLKTALSICAVLKLDPFLFLPNAEELNNYLDVIQRNNPTIMHEDAILQLLAHAMHLFNSKVGTDYTSDNIKMAFCTRNNIEEIYNAFTSQYGFHAESGSSSRFSSELAEAFIGQTDCGDPEHVDGILIRTDPPANLDSPESYLYILVHELAHIFCTTHEIDSAEYKDQRFYDHYCAGTPTSSAERISDGQMNAGYAIWREFIADIMADIVYQQPSMHIEEMKDTLLLLAHDMKVGNPAAKSCLRYYLSNIMNSWEGGEIESWPDLKKILEKYELPFLNIVHLVFDQLHTERCYEITPEFITDLGNAYMMAAIQNTPPAEIMEFANKFSYKY